MPTVSAVLNPSHTADAARAAAEVALGEAVANLLHNTAIANSDRSHAISVHLWVMCDLVLSRTGEANVRAVVRTCWEAFRLDEGSQSETKLCEIYSR